MSCENCEKEQELQEKIYWYRWKAANIAVLGCQEHVKEIFDVLNNYQDDISTKKNRR